MSSSSPVQTLIDELLQEQRSLTAVERFSERHASCSTATQQRYYKDLIPVGLPGEGQQFAFSVDLDRCSSCKGCVTACHSLNGLEEGETWRSVGLVVGEVEDQSVQRSVTTACHHCVDPGCLNGCPVLAYDKDPVMGIVRHLDDQCIGCEYCVMKCPYEVPQYSERLGIVRKCDICYGRLSEGEAPACVQACPDEAIEIRIVDKQVTSGNCSSGTRLVPGAADSKWTQPSTVYKTSLNGGVMDQPGNPQVKSGKAHLPLVFMLVLTQWGIGSLFLGGIPGFQTLLAAGGITALGFDLAAAFLVFAGLGASIFHLGQPLKAWRVFLGWRRSWLSREAMVLGALAPCILALVGIGVAAELSLKVPIVLSGSGPGLATRLVCLVIGSAGVFCSVMVYADTGRRVWVLERTAYRFGFSCLVGMGQTGLLVSMLAVFLGKQVPVILVLGSYAACLLGNAAKLFQEASEDHEADVGGDW